MTKPKIEYEREKGGGAERITLGAYTCFKRKNYNISLMRMYDEICFKILNNKEKRNIF